MIKKENKLFVVIHNDTRIRKQMIAKLATKLGFAKIPSDAAKLIRADISDYLNLGTAYFILCGNYNFKDSPETNHRLYEMAARGLAVIVGVRSLPSEYEFISQCIYPEDL